MARRGKDTVITYLACTRRNTDTMEYFLGVLKEEGLAYKVVYQATLDTESALFVYNEIHIPIKIYKISMIEETKSLH